MSPLQITDVPDEFKLSAYDICESWKLNEWALALSSRSSLRKNWSLACAAGKSSLVPSKMIDDNKLAALRYFIKPLGDESSLFSTENCVAPIRNQTVADFFEGHACFIDPAYEYWANHFELSGLIVDGDTNLLQHDVFDAELTESARTGAKVCSEKASWEMHNEVSEFLNPFFIAVDLGAPDDFLQHEFKVWLKSVRKAAGVNLIRRTVNASDLKRWHEQRLLPYLDLAYWAMIHEKRITLPNFALALFPDKFDEGVEDIVRKTTQPRASEIIGDEFLSALRLQIWMSFNRPTQ